MMMSGWMRPWRAALLAATVVLTSSGWRVQAASVELVEDGQPRAVVVLPAEPEADEQLAADELVLHLRKMSGAELGIVSATAELPDKLLPIYVGGAANADLDRRTREQGDDPSSFALVVERKRIDVRGLSPAGTLIGVYELLEQLGVRWFFPGDIGTVIPATRTVEVERQTTVQAPSFPARWAAGHVSKKKTWQRRLRMGGPHFPPAHGVHLPKSHAFEEHPEYYALIDGERKKRQLCVSNPEVLKGAVETTKAHFAKSPDSPWIGIGPNDGRGYCECENCTALDGGDWDPFAAHMSMTDRYVWFFNEILKGIEDEYPDKRICFYSYASYNRPPVKYTPDPRIIPAFAPITLCRIHGLGNPICPEKDKYYRWLVQEWGKIIPDVYDRGYWFNLADPGLLFPMVHRIRAQIPISHELGITGWRVECLGHWGSETPSLYIAGKLMWDHEADVDELLQDFCEKYFGPAGDPMRRYLDVIDSAVRDADVHTGCSHDIPNLYPAETRKHARALLAEAAGQTGDDVYAERVRIFTEVFAYTEAFIDMLERRAAHDWAGAREALARLDSLRETVTSYETEMVVKRYAVSYLKRFFRPCTEQGIERALDTGRLLAGLNDEWEFNMDAEQVGESLQWYTEDLTGGNWRTIRSSSQSWSNQGLRYYKGAGWYRQRVTIPADAKGQKVLLWFGGVDELASVWVNGQPLGDSPGRAFVPFEMDASAVVRPGEVNLLVVRVRNTKLNELGTGGITAPVFFWSPKQGEHEAEQGDRDVTPVEFE